MMIRALIIEDETAAARNLRAILKKVAPAIEVEAMLESVVDSVAWLRRNPQPDLLFVDIHLADGDSFRIFQEVEVVAPVIFTTAYDRYALEAFKLNSIDYLLKPINEEAVSRALDKLQRLTGSELGGQRERVRALSEERTETFLVYVGDRIIPLNRNQIAFIHTADERVTAVDFEGRNYPMDKTLETLQAMLPEDAFFRANRQFIVARRAVKEIGVWFGSRLSVQLSVATPEKIIVSKARASEFKQWMCAVQPRE